MRALATRRRGATLLEIVIGSVVGTMIVGLVALTVLRSNTVFEQVGVTSDVDSAAMRAAERVAREFMDADRSTLALLPSPTAGASSATFARVAGFTAGAQTMRPMQRVSFEYAQGEIDDGLDNDGNGLIDDGRVVLERDVATAGSTDAVLIDHVAELLDFEAINGADDNGNGLIDESGLCLTYDTTSFTLRVRLTIARRAPDGSTVVRTAETTVRLRND